MIKKCVVCGRQFDSPPSTNKITCSKECSLIRKSKNHRGKSNVWGKDARLRKSAQGVTDNLRRGTPAAKKSPRAGRFETNINAKTWVLKSPENVIVEVKNLKNWARNNTQLFGEDNTEEAAIKIASGIRQLKRSMEGKRGPVSSYKDWQLISWGDSEMGKRHNR